MVRHNYFVKRWIITALSAAPSPITAKGVLDIIKSQRDPKTNRNARRSPNLSTIKLATIMCRMKEVKTTRGQRNQQGHYNLYSLRNEYEDL